MERVNKSAVAPASKRAALMFIMVLLLLTASACADGEVYSDESSEPIDGQVTQESGSTYDYIGWWALEGEHADAPFAFVEIRADDSSIVDCYDKDGAYIDTAYNDYSEQRALNGKSLMVFAFENIGEYGVSPYKSGDDSYFGIMDGSGFDGVFKLDNSGALAAKFAVDYSFTIHNGTDCEISSVLIGPSEGSAGEDMEALSSALAAGESAVISGSAPASTVVAPEWTLYITDSNGDTSAYYDEFNLLEVSSAEICRDADTGGYYCEFIYDR